MAGGPTVRWMTRLTALALVGLAVTGSRVSGQEERAVARTRYFALYSDPWINLHHFLYQWARADEGVGRGRQAVAVPEREDMGSLSAADRASWSAALEFYRAHVARLDHFDNAMLVEKDRLVALEGDTSRRPPDEIPGIADALVSAMPVYLGRWWPRHDRMNRSWIAEETPLIRANEEGYAAVAVRSFGGTWPPEALRVDVSAYANWAGGYTSVDPDHTVILSTDPGNEGLKGLETVLHESSHRLQLQRPSRETIAEAFAATGSKPNPNLWHALIFYTAGSYVRGVAEREGTSDFVPHAVAEGLTGFRGWEGLWDALDAEWPAVLAGDRSREEAMRAVARRLTGS